MKLEDLERIVAHAQAAQAAVNALGAGPPQDGMAKIRQKVKPREYKTGPRRRGRDRLAHQLLKLTLDVSRFVTKAGTSQADREWAGNLLFQLQQLRHYQTTADR